MRAFEGMRCSNSSLWVLNRFSFVIDGFEKLGHADTNITARIYSHQLPDDDARAADAWETVIVPIQ